MTNEIDKGKTVILSRANDFQIELRNLEEAGFVIDDRGPRIAFLKRGDDRVKMVFDITGKIDRKHLE